MENENKTNHTVTNNPDPTGVRTFTQEEVNRIVSERLSRDRDKRAAELDEREKAIKVRELAVIAAEKLAAAGLPKELNAVLKYDDEESLEAAINQLSTLRGFEKNNRKPKRIYEEYRLPEGNHEERTLAWQLRNAMRLPD